MDERREPGMVPGSGISDAGKDGVRAPDVRAPDMSGYGRSRADRPRADGQPGSHARPGRQAGPAKRGRGKRRRSAAARRYGFIAAAAAVALLCGSALFWYYYPASVWSDRKPAGLILNGDPCPEDTYRVIGGKLFIRYDTANAAIGSTLFYEPATSRVILTTGDRIIEMRTDLLTTYVNYQPVSIDIPVSMDDGSPYVSVDFLVPIYGLSVERYDNGIFNVSDGRQPLLIAKTLADTVLRESPAFRSAKVLALSSGETLTVYEETGGWYRVRSSKGILGYADKRKVAISGMIRAEEERVLFDPPWQPVGGKINLTWDLMGVTRNDMSSYEPVPGLNVISPTWFSLLDAGGNVKSLGSTAYTDWAHRQGLQVWALFSNSFDPDITGPVLRSFDLRRKVISQILVLAQTLDVDGINIDFENIDYGDSASLTQFVRELSVMLHELDLTVSMDVTIRSANPNWSMVYDRPALSEAVDYIAVMTYDEHWASSPEAGSVASLPWVRKGLERILEQVPAEKLLLGIPFYTRLWQETPLEDGAVKVVSKAYSMDQVRSILAEKGAVPVWDETDGQYYAEYEEDGNTFKVWLEDETSVRSRVDLMKEYSLAGIASWEMGNESDGIWEAILEELTARP